MIYGYIFCWLGTMALVASLGEMASMYEYNPLWQSRADKTNRMPLSGGQYHWVSLLAPARFAKFLSYITGTVYFVPEKTWKVY